MPNKLRVKKDDTVMVITGKEKGKSGKVLKTSPKDGRIVVEKINVRVKHKKARNAQDVGGRIDMESPIDVSNVMVVCGKCKKPTRVEYKVTGEGADRQKLRICKKCGEALGK